MPGVNCGIRALSRRGTKGGTQRSGRVGNELEAPGGVFARCLNEGRSQPASVQASGGGLRSVCQGLAHGQEGASLVQCRPGAVGSGVFVRVLPKDRKEPAWFSAGTGRWAQECLSSPGRGRDPASFRAGTEMGAQESVLGESNKGQT